MEGQRPQVRNELLRDGLLWSRPGVWDSDRLQHPPPMPPYLDVLTTGGPQPRQRPSVVLHEATLIVHTNWLSIDSGQRPPVQRPSIPPLLLTSHLALLPLVQFLLVILASLLFLHPSCPCLKHSPTASPPPSKFRSNVIP